MLFRNKGYICIILKAFFQFTMTMDSTKRDNSEAALKAYYPWTSMEENGRQPMQAFLIKEDRKFFPSYGLLLTTLCFTLIIKFVIQTVHFAG